MKHKQLEHKITLIVVLLVLLSFFLYLTTVKSLTQAPSPSANSYPTQTIAINNYQSDLLNFSIDYPSTVRMELHDTTVTLFGTNSVDYIYISRASTNFENIQDYVEDLSVKNHFTVVDRIQYQQYGQDILTGIVDHDKTYFIYIDGWVYTISTSSPELYDELDQIARSFRYIP